MAPFKAAEVPRPPPKVNFSERIKKAGGVVVAKTGAMRVKISKGASNVLKRVKQKLGLGDTQDVGAGNRDSPTEGDSRTPDQKIKQQEDDPNSQHSAQGKEKTKKSFMDKVQGGALAGLGALSMAILLAAIIQGGIDCTNLDQADFDITDVRSAAWPEYPEWWPAWAPTPQSDANKVWISYSPAVHLLTTDTISVKTSNTAGDVQTSITGDHGILNNDDDAMTLVQIAEKFDPNATDFSNVTAKFVLTTNCEDRIAYTAGKDVAAVTSATSNAFGQFFNAIPWKTILLIAALFISGYMLFKGISILRS
jgi:hypothetical protein